MIYYRIKRSKLRQQYRIHDAQLRRVCHLDIDTSSLLTSQLAAQLLIGTLLSLCHVYRVAASPLLILLGTLSLTSQAYTVKLCIERILLDTLLFRLLSVVYRFEIVLNLLYGHSIELGKRINLQRVFCQRINFQRIGFQRIDNQSIEFQSVKFYRIKFHGIEFQ